jgi:hypothetical protein
MDLNSVVEYFEKSKTYIDLGKYLWTQEDKKSKSKRHIVRRALFSALTLPVLSLRLNCPS